MFSIPFVLFPGLLCVSVVSAQSHVCDFTRYLQASLSDSYLTSPNYPLAYSPSTTCQWIITTSIYNVVELTFVTFETEGYFSSGSCSSYSSDYLEVYDGQFRTSSKLLGKYCSDDLPANVYSSGTSLYLRFVSNRYTGKKGFKIKYKAVRPMPNSAICSPFNTFSRNNDIQVYGSSGSIESPLYGDKYPSNMQCTWVITVPAGKTIQLTYESYFSVGGASYCSASYNTHRDYVQIRNGRYSFSTVLRTDCGQNKPSASSGSSDSATVVGIVIGVCILIFLVCMCVCIAKRKRTPGLFTVRAPGAAPTTTTVQGIQYPQQAQGNYVPPPPIGHMPGTQSSYPSQASGYSPPSQGSYPLGSYPNKTTYGSGTSAPGYPSQSTVPPMVPYPTTPIPDDPPPPYPGPPAGYPPQAASGQPNPPYPPVQGAGTQTSPPYPPQAGQPNPSNPPYPPVQGAETQQASPPYPPQAGQPNPSNPNPPYPPPQGAEMQQSSPPYPTAQGNTQVTAPPPF